MNYKNQISCFNFIVKTNLMRRVVAYCWTAFAYLASGTGLWLKTDNVVIQQTQDPTFDRVVLECFGGSGHYDYHYPYLPRGFIPKDNTLFFSSGYFKQKKRAEVEVEIVDIKTQEKLKRVVILEEHKGKFQVFDRRVLKRSKSKSSQKESSSSLRSSKDGDSSSSNKEGESRSSDTDSRHYLGYRRKEKDSSDSSDSNHYYGYYDSSSDKNKILSSQSSKQTEGSSKESSKQTKSSKNTSKESSSSKSSQERKSSTEKESSKNQRSTEKETKSQQTDSTTKRNQKDSSSKRSRNKSDSTTKRERSSSAERKRKQTKIKIDEKLVVPSEAHIELFIEGGDIRQLEEILYFIVREKGVSCQKKVNFLTGYVRKLDRYLGHLPILIQKCRGEISNSNNFSYLERKKGELKNLQIKKTRLQQIYYQFQRIYNIEYFQCHGVSVEETVIDEEVSSVKITSKDFSSYVKKEFNFQARKYIKTENDYVQIKQINFYGLSWRQRFEYNFTAENEDYESLQCNDYQTVYEGSITKIHGNRIYARDSNSYDYELELGKCSRLEVATGRKFPQIGDRIYFKGGAKKGRKVKLHKCLCY